jgi:parallel beta-helix repeat protein
MSAFQLFKLPKNTQIDSSVRVTPGAKAHFYATTTTTPQDTYTTSALNVAHANPVVADGNGVFAPIYLDPSLVYKLTLTTSADVLIYTVDPVNDQVLSQSIIGALLYPITANEIAAGVTPVNYAYSPFPVVELDRYGVDADGVTNDTAKIQDAIDGAVAGTVIDGRGRAFGVTQINVNKRIRMRGLNLVMLNPSGATAQQNGFNVTADNVVIDNCGCTIDKTGIANAANASGVYAASVSGLRVLGGVWDGSKQNDADYSSNIFGSPIQAVSCDDIIVDGAIVSNADAEGVFLWTCTNSKVTKCNVTDSEYSGIAVDLGSGNEVLNNTVDSTTASGISFNSVRGRVLGNLVLDAQTSGITLGHPGYPVDDTICALNTVSNYGISTTNPSGFGGINVQGGERVKVRNNLIKASADNTATSDYNHGIQLGNLPVSVEVIGNTIDSAYGYGIRSTDSDDAQLAMICDNTISNAWFDGIVVVGCSRAMIKGNRVFQPNRADDANAFGISVTRTGTADPLTLEFDGNTIIDADSQMRHGINVYSMGGTSLIETVRNNTIRGALTSPVNTGGGWQYNLIGNDLAGGARSGSVTLAAAATSTNVSTGECTIKTQPIVMPGNAAAAALAIWFGTASAGSFSIGSGSAVGTEVVLWVIP